jgi:hypothetical protein
LPTPLDRYQKATGDHDIERIGHIALPHQDLAALQREGLKLSGQTRALGRIEIREDLNPVQAVLYDVRFHRPQE